MYQVYGLPLDEIIKIGGAAITGGAAALAIARATADRFFNREYETIIVYQALITPLGVAAYGFERNEVLSGRLPDIIRGSNIRELMTDAAKHCVVGQGIAVDRRFLAYADDTDAEEVGKAVKKALRSLVWRQRFLDEADGIASRRITKYFIVGGADSPINSKKVIRVTIVNHDDLEALCGQVTWKTEGDMNRIGLETAKVLADSVRRTDNPFFHSVRGVDRRIVHPIDVPVPLVP